MSASHVLAFFNGSAAAERALIDAADVAREADAELTVLVLAAVEEPARCCNLQTTAWNREMRHLAREELEHARLLLAGGVRVSFVVREGKGHADVDAAASDLGCDLLVEPRSRRRAPRRSVLA